MKNPEQDWESLIKSIRKAAHLLGETLSERDMPDYQNWFVAREMHKSLWARVRARQKRNKVKL